MHCSGDHWAGQRSRRASHGPGAVHAREHAHTQSHVRRASALARPHLRVARADARGSVWTTPQPNETFVGLGSKPTPNLWRPLSLTRHARGIHSPTLRFLSSRCHERVVSCGSRGGFLRKKATAALPARTASFEADFSLKVGFVSVCFKQPDIATGAHFRTILSAGAARRS